ncbi:exopolysaccharide Pel transporter PelG [Pseudothermotoga thermarum]|uniref:Transmembrane protein n=1 Tax=Pseudothermotoga thermarum DSM 5069 TaxID=688269 RepID=F7YUX3_9THEM|nr:exopolysaccharide Pel transporter PelG [Pseudothermotoga thermarum]AEH51535.1 hypothetical protein Theth_1478 [Pseudothermotoga thermarum DSM 5069]
MAGIGFRLNRMFYRGSVSSDILAIFYSMLVAAGPWIITAASLFAILYFFDIEDPYLFVSLVYGFIISVIFSGLTNTFLTRRVSDHVYTRNYKKIFPETMGLLLVANSLLALFCVLFLGINKHEAWFIFAFTYLCVSLLSLWIVSVASLATENIQLYIVSYIIFGVTAALFVRFFGDGSFDKIMGFSLSVNLSMFLHLINTLRSFGTEEFISFKWFGALKKYWENIFIGLAYNLAIWIDEFVVWRSKTYSQEILKGFRFSSYYDLPMFISYLSIIPTVVMFVMVLETRFYRRYHEFYSIIISRSTLNDMELAKDNMAEELRKSVELTVIIQLFFSTLLFIANEIGIFSRAFYVEKAILRIGIVGAMFNGFYLTITLLLLYFDFRRDVLWLNTLTFLCNLSLSIWFVNKAPYTLLPASYTISFTIFTFVSYAILLKKVEKIIQIEFSRQKIQIEKGVVRTLKDLRGDLR